MGIDAQTQDERGVVIGKLLDPQSLTQILISDEANRTTCLRFIDPYGDTLFNQLQIPVLISELEKMIAVCTNAEAKQHGEELLTLIVGAKDEVHIYVKFIGD
jgi:hypothetical protein